MQITPLMIARERKGVSLGDMAKALKTSRGHLSRIERGERRPNLDLAKKISDFFATEITRDQILFPEEYAARSNNRRLKKAS